MGRITRYFRHLILGMVQGCLILAVIAAVLAVVASLIINHALPHGYSFFSLSPLSSFRVCLGPWLAWSGDSPILEIW